MGAPTRPPVELDASTFLLFCHRTARARVSVFYNRVSAKLGLHSAKVSESHRAKGDGEPRLEGVDERRLVRPAARALGDDGVHVHVDGGQPDLRILSETRCLWGGGGSSKMQNTVLL